LTSSTVSTDVWSESTAWYEESLRGGFFSCLHQTLLLFTLRIAWKIVHFSHSRTLLVVQACAFFFKTLKCQRFDHRALSVSDKVTILVKCGQHRRQVGEDLLVMIGWWHAMFRLIVGTLSS
jgi:hypothetical protein